MHSKLEGYKSRLVALRDENLSYTQKFGDDGFGEIEESKNRGVCFLLDYLERADRVIEFYPELWLDRGFQPLEAAVENVERFKTHVDQLVQLGTHGENFHSKREAQCSSARDYSVEKDARFQEMQVSLIAGEAIRGLADANLSETVSKISDLEAQALALIESIGKSKKEAEKIESQLREISAKESVSEARSSYNARSVAHAEREAAWFKALVFAGIFLVTLICYIFFNSTVPGNVPEAILGVFRKSVLIAVVVAFLKVSLTKYNAERHLRITYDHRASSVLQLELIVNSIQDEDTRDALRVEGAKIILSDPDTAYSKGGDSSEVNINPVFSALEMATKRGSK